MPMPMRGLENSDSHTNWSRRRDFTTDTLFEYTSMMRSFHPLILYIFNCILVFVLSLLEFEIILTVPSLDSKLSYNKISNKPSKI